MDTICLLVKFLADNGFKIKSKDDPTLHRPAERAEAIADELTAIAVEALDKLSPEEREKRIQAFENSVAAAAQAKGKVSQ